MWFTCIGNARHCAHSLIFLRKFPHLKISIHASLIRRSILVIRIQWSVRFTQFACRHWQTRLWCVCSKHCTKLSSWNGGRMEILCDMVETRNSDFVKPLNVAWCGKDCAQTQQAESLKGHPRLESRGDLQNDCQVRTRTLWQEHRACFAWCCFAGFCLLFSAKQERPSCRGERIHIVVQAP